ncbi:hypothetical protein [Marinomonas transparens]|uniref:Uncharacterized protein n=1 Tax=Marinomonas transparens TaxID=2795388 RepID=A0A934JUT7_9GAMM|nr:hypothetical protein [Marinomonas transparens]MBJ7538746.1 hypothetical protein [Marinomonas transparens]
MEEFKLAFEAINIYQTQYAQVDKVWGYFSVVTLAMVGFVIANGRTTQSFKEPIAIVLAYIIFCFGNHQALVDGQRQLEQFATIAKLFANKVELDVSAIAPMSHSEVQWFHISVIIAVCVGVLTVAWLRRSHKKPIKQD